MSNINKENTSLKSVSILKLIDIWNHSAEETDHMKLHTFDTNQPMLNKSAKIIKLNTREFLIQESSRTIKVNFLQIKNKPKFIKTLLYSFIYELYTGK